MGINFHVSNKSSSPDYYEVYIYINKQDTQPFLSQGYPNLEAFGSPKIRKCTRTNNIKRISSATGAEVLPKVKQLTSYGVTKFIRNNNVETEDELLKNYF